MNPDVVLQLFSVHFGLCIYVYWVFPNTEKTYTVIHDGMENGFNYKSWPGLIEPDCSDDSAEQTIGLVYDGNFYHYLEFTNI